MTTEHWLAVLGILGPVAAVFGSLILTRVGWLIGLYYWQRHEKGCRAELHAEAGRRHHPHRMEDYDGPY